MSNFVAGYTYANRDYLQYGSPKGRVTQNKQQAGYPEVDWICQSVTKTFATFLDETATVQRRRVYSDNLGKFVYPKGRFSGAPVLRAEYAYNNGTLVPDSDYNQDNDNQVGPY